MDRSLNYSSDVGRTRFCKLCTGSVDHSSARFSGDQRLFGSRLLDFANTVEVESTGNSQSVIKCPICYTNIIVKSREEKEKTRLDSMERYGIPSLSFSSENGDLPLCDTCDLGEPEVTCVECDQKLCFECVKVHLRATTTRRHHITGIISGDVTPRASRRRSPSPSRSVSPVRNGTGRRSPSPVRHSVTLSPNRLTERKRSPSPKRNKSTNDVPFRTYSDSGVEDSLSPISPFESYSFTPTSAKPLTRASYLIHEDYQRGNSPRPNETGNRKFEFRPQQAASCWKNDFSQISMFELPSYVLSMCPGSRDQCWIAEAMSSAIHLYNSEGQHIRSVDIHNEVRDMVVNKATDEVFVSCFASKNIKVVNTVDEVDLFATANLHPAGISVNSYGDVIVCVVEDYRRRYKPEHRNKLIVFNKEGRLKKEIERDQRGDKLFAYPEYIDVNINGDILVSDIEKEGVVILSAEGKFKKLYKGPPKGTLDKPFDPRDLKCDKDGNIVVCDINNNALHLLDINGEFQRLLLAEEDSLYWPDVVCIDNRGHIWVRELWQHTVKIFQNV
ncbi:hypothetical protein FSP39_021455 [Pinctada imbricata]|uniref:B box-type domain-containing protein n=1 Tax=Pinctada imbricata TaxID=66713 RepID=A0AA88XIF4_PINIB|nr:hypothetical protein FSP39_021455 [Pinctada imbricata]